MQQLSTLQTFKNGLFWRTLQLTSYFGRGLIARSDEIVVHQVVGVSACYMSLCC